MHSLNKVVEETVHGVAYVGERDQAALLPASSWSAYLGFYKGTEGAPGTLVTTLPIS